VVISREALLGAFSVPPRLSMEETPSGPSCQNPRAKAKKARKRRADAAVPGILLPG
jgi:hypothetical protein